jgi:hypothetical protein
VKIPFSQDPTFGQIEQRASFSGKIISPLISEWNSGPGGLFLAILRNVLSAICVHYTGPVFNFIRVNHDDSKDSARHTNSLVLPVG